MTGVTPAEAAAVKRARRAEWNEAGRVPMRAITIRIPETLYTELHALMVDPANGCLRYGTWGRTIEDIIRAWVNTQKVHSG